MSTLSSEKDKAQVAESKLSEDHFGEEEAQSEDDSVRSAAGDDDDDGEEEDLETNEERLEKEEAEALKADLGEDLREGKRIRRAETKTDGEQSVDVTTTGPSSSSNEIWKGMQDEGESSTSAADAKEELVRVVCTYRFAGEEVTDEKMLPASSAEAKAYLAKQQDADAARSASSLHEQQRARPPPSSSSHTPGPRKRKAGGLAAMSAAATAKPTKLNTLEKSKMDWSKFKDTTLNEQAKHELDAQTRGGGSGLGSMKGYMERRNFLERVQGRLDGQGEKK